jgi:ribosome-associated toxin RatA of RatAB toxin-antitoxin module
MKKGALATFLLCIALALPVAGRAQGQAAQAAAQLSTRQEGMVLVVEGWMRTLADRATAWAVLTDYDRFPAFVPGISGNRVLESGNGIKTIAQRGQVLAGQVRMPYEGIMRVTEHRLEGMDIQFLSGPFKDVGGSWRMDGDGPLTLRYSLRMDLSRTPFPPPLAPTIAQQQVSTWVDAFGREIERRAGK